MSRVVVREKGQVTIPAGLRRAAHIEEGDPMEVELTAEGILLRPQKVIDSTQAWFWTADWQAGEREASEQIAAGALDTFKGGEEFLDALGNQRG